MLISLRLVRLITWRGILDTDLVNLAILSLNNQTTKRIIDESWTK
jgi:hypothetical protein